jgi:hypothetical protein
VVVPPVDHECALTGIVAELSNQLEKVKHELAQLKKAHIRPKSERSKMPRIPSAPVTAEEKLAKRRAQDLDIAVTNLEGFGWRLLRAPRHSNVLFDATLGVRDCLRKLITQVRRQ